MRKYCVLLLVFLVENNCPIFSQSETVSIVKIKTLLHKKINDYRETEKLSPYIIDEGLEKSAQNQCNYISSIQKLTHKQPDNKFQTSVDRIRYFSQMEYMSYGENCLKTYSSILGANSQDIEEIAQKMFQMWCNSKQHNSNLLHRRFTHAGFGFHYNAETEELYCVMDYGGN